MVRFTCPANPGGITPASGPPGPGAGLGPGPGAGLGPGPGSGRRTRGPGLTGAVRAAAEGPGVHGEQDVQVSLGALKEYVQRMKSLPGQRTLILVSPGFLTLTTQALAEINLMPPEFATVLRKALEHGDLTGSAATLNETR